MTRKELKLIKERVDLYDILRTAQRLKPAEFDGYQLFMLGEVKADYDKVCKKLKRYDR